MKALKSLLVVLCFVLLCFSFVSCNNKDSDNNDKESVQNEENDRLIKLTMADDSMEPLIEENATVYVEEIDTATLEVGDVIAYERIVSKTEKVTVISRIVDVSEIGTFMTKGDKDDAEFELVLFTDIIGKYVKHTTD